MQDLSVPMTWIRKAAAACTECGMCHERCEVMRNPATSVGTLCKKMLTCQGEKDETTPDGQETFLANVAALAQTDPGYIFTIRHCCMCGYCTIPCPARIDARETFTALREILHAAGVTTTEGFESTQVDKEWHIFSVYRAVHGIHYTDVPHIDQAAALAADTLFFPGCSLASYGPELTREILTFLEANGVNAVIDEDCCGVPLKAGGFGDRERSYVTDKIATYKAAGIKRIVTVCPGCMYELERQTPRGSGLRYQSLTALLAEKDVRVSPEQVERAYKRAMGIDEDVALDRDLKVTVYDSCYDRDGRSGKPLRAMFKEIDLVDMPHSGDVARCCGAGGSVSLVDPELSETRVQRVLDWGGDVADLMVTNCPTCAYTLAYQRFAKGEESGGVDAHLNYLDILFQNGFDWKREFDQLGSMWYGEYGEWAAQQLS